MTVGSRFRSFKSRLVRDYLRDEIDRLDLEDEVQAQGGDLEGERDGGGEVQAQGRGLPDPWIRYEGFITKDQWEIFKASRLTQRARVIYVTTFKIFHLLNLH